MNLLKYTQSSRYEDTEEDFKRVEPESFESFDAEGGTRGRADDEEGSGAESSFSLGSGRPAAPVSPANRKSRSGVSPKKNSSVQDETHTWPLLRNQFLRPKALRLDAESFLDGESGLEYLLHEMDK